MHSGAPRTGDIQTTHQFGDVQLHIEWAAPVPISGASQGRGNSGVFLIGGRALQLDLQQDGRFRVRGGDVVLAFAEAAGSPPPTVTMHIGGDQIIFERQAE